MSSYKPPELAMIFAATAACCTAGICAIVALPLISVNAGCAPVIAPFALI